MMSRYVPSKTINYLKSVEDRYNDILNTQCLNYLRSIKHLDSDECHNVIFNIYVEQLNHDLAVDKYNPEQKGFNSK